MHGGARDTVYAYSNTLREPYNSGRRTVGNEGGELMYQDTHSKVIGYLLWIFGFLGSHRFYYGKRRGIIPVYINCWKHNTTFKIFTEACEMLDFKFIQNKKTEELFKMIKQVFNKKSVVFVFDEADKLEDLDFLYMIMEEIYRKTIILITNYREWVTSLEDRIKSRLMPEMIEFRPYNYEETKGILKQRAEYAFHPGVLSCRI